MSRFALFSIAAGTLATLSLQSASAVLGVIGAMFHLLVPLPAAYITLRQGVGAGGGRFSADVGGSSGPRRP